MDESSQRIRRAVAVVVVRPLGAQPSIDYHCRLLFQIGKLLGCCSYKATPSTYHYGGVLSHWTKTMPKVQGGWWKAAEGSAGSFVNQPKWSLAPPPISQLMKKSTQELRVCIYVCRSPPPACQYDWEGPPPLESQGVDKPPEMPAGQGL